ncbi:hypothetical protein MKX03_009205 [Papaver bracteatum]|nr:hypothetical protein MKX03_009205 [Papaver bracteatum]
MVTFTYFKKVNEEKSIVFLTPKFVMRPGYVSNKYYNSVYFPRGHIAIKEYIAEEVLIPRMKLIFTIGSLLNNMLPSPRMLTDTLGLDLKHDEPPRRYQIFMG